MSFINNAQQETGRRNREAYPAHSVLESRRKRKHSPAYTTQEDQDLVPTIKISIKKQQTSLATTRIIS